LVWSLCENGFKTWDENDIEVIVFLQFRDQQHIQQNEGNTSN